MEENKPQSNEDHQSKEEKKIEGRYEQSLRQLTALSGGPGWEKPVKLNKLDLPEIMRRIVEKKKEEIFLQFEGSYTALVEEKRKLDKTMADKEKEFKKVILDSKKEYLKKVDAALSIIQQMDQIEREYYQTLGRNEEEPEQPGTIDEPSND